jgi:hypothetical protein
MNQKFEIQNISGILESTKKSQSQKDIAPGVKGA